jgi:hypothetical protein
MSNVLQMDEPLAGKGHIPLYPRRWRYAVEKTMLIAGVKSLQDQAVTCPHSLVFSTMNEPHLAFFGCILLLLLQDAA